MVERLGNSCGTAGAPHQEEQISWTSALVGSVTLPSLKTASMEGDGPGRAGTELCSEKLSGLSCAGNAFYSGEDDEDIGARLLSDSDVGVKKDRPAATAGGWLASQLRTAVSKSHSRCAPHLLPLCPTAPWQPGQWESQRSCQFGASPGSARVEYLEWRGEAPSNYRFSISALGIPLSRLKITLLTNFFSLAL